MAVENEEKTILQVLKFLKTGEIKDKNIENKIKFLMKKYNLDFKIKNEFDWMNEDPF